MENEIFFSLLTILTIASVRDLITKKIPNTLIFLGLITGLGVSIYLGGFDSFGKSILAIIITFICLIWFWGIMGAGDLKLLIVVASFLGVTIALKIALISIFIGTVFFIILSPRKVINSAKGLIYLIFYKVPFQAVSKINAVAFSPFILCSFLFYALTI